MAFVAQVQFESLRTLKDGSISFTLSTQELPPESVTNLMAFRMKPAVVALSEKGFTEEAVNELEKIKIDMPKTKGKSKSQILRAVFYRIWESSPNNFENADDHYNYMMDKVIDFYKEKIQ